VLDHGAFSTTARVVFVALAGMAAAAALLAGGHEAARAALHPFVGVLIALSAFGALSSLWTVGLPGDALAWALLPAGYALLAAAVLAASVGAAVRVRTTVLGTVCGCAFASGVVGLVGAATFTEPRAFWLNGVWRPAGTLEYAPALVLLEVCALAALLRALSSRGRLAWLAAAPLGVAGAVLGLSNSRLGLAMAVVVLAGSVVAARTTRRRALRGVALVLLAGVVARVGLGGIGPAASGSDTWRVAIVIGICVLSPLAWWLLDSAARRSQPIARAGAVAGLVAAVSLAVLLAPGATGRAAPPAHPQAVRSVHRDVLHGRGQIWSAGIRAFGRRPLQGYGAGSFLAATADLQRPVITSYAHDLPLELGVELGVAGALLGLSLYLIAARAWWRARNAAGVSLLVVPALAFLTANLVDWPWHVGGIGAVWAAATAALIAAGAGITPGRRIPSRPSTVRRAATERCK
jgi:hypothetical protein